MRKRRRAKTAAAAKLGRGTEGASRPQSAPVNLLPAISGPELVFGLVGPIGTDMRLVASKLEEQLDAVGYSSVHVHVSDALREFGTSIELTERPIEDRYRTYMDAGNQLRERLHRHDALALLAVNAIRHQRRELTGDRIRPRPNTAYILNQFKRPEEIETLRKVYGRGFIQISAYCSREKRLDDLTGRIAKSHYREKSNETYRATAQSLISRDDAEEEVLFGQRVRDTFPLADVVINAESESLVRQTCARFVRVFFGDNFCSPTRDEFGMYMAKSAALRSSDLSRQVGAAIATESAEIIAIGCNEVPRAGGGAYWEGDTDDYRDFRVGYDSSTRVKREILEDVFRRLKDREWLSPEKQAMEIEALVNAALTDGNSGALADAQIMDILEFGRVVHSEMAAITDAARRGLPLQGATLYCTTFPCHICARHIVAAGIRRVIYIEPYAKSLAAELYPDSIEVEGRTKLPGEKVIFQPFIGIGPQRYAELFSKGRRKDKNGNAMVWDAKKAVPILERLVPAYLSIEQAVVDGAVEMLSAAGLR